MWRKPLRMFVWTAVIFAVLCGLVYIVLEPWTIPADDAQLSASIEPTLSGSDVVLVTRGTGASDGALVRCADPDAVGRYVIGRVVGHGGDVVEFTAGTLFVNAKVAGASGACDPPTMHITNPTTKEDEELNCALEDLGGGFHGMLRPGAKSVIADSKTTVDQGKVFLVSDNRGMHLDSRDFTAVQSSTCQRIAARLWGGNGWLDTKKRLTLLW
jgi:signal peptidase I